MIQYYKNDNGVLYYGDALSIDKHIKPESIQCVITSPPYWGKIIYGVDGEIGLEETPDFYIEQIVEIFKSIKKALHPTGTIWLNIGDTNCVPSTVRETILGMKPGVPAKNRIGIPWRTVLALQQDGWHFRCDIIWWRPNSPREPVQDRPTYEHEYIFLLSKNQKYYYDNFAVALPYNGQYAGNRRNVSIESGGMFDAGHDIKAKLTHRNLGSVWEISTQGRSDKHQSFPDELATRCIKAGTSSHGCCSECYAPIERKTERESKDAERKTIGWFPTCKCDAPIIPCTVLDPFMGRGTTALVAESLNRNWIGSELSQESCELIKQNLLTRKLGLHPTKIIEDGLFNADEIDISIQ